MHPRFILVMPGIFFFFKVLGLEHSCELAIIKWLSDVQKAISVETCHNLLVRHFTLFACYKHWLHIIYKVITLDK